MPMSKSEMKNEYDNFLGLERAAQSACNTWHFEDAIRHAVSSWEFLEGMMRYARKIESREFSTISTMEIVLNCSPIILHSSSLVSLDDLLKKQRGIEKNTKDNLRAKVADARRMMFNAHRIWDQLEQHGPLSVQTLRSEAGVDEEFLRNLLRHWEQLSLIHSTKKDDLQIVGLFTDMERISFAKCPSCGAVGRAAKFKLLEDRTCPQCRMRTSFVFLLREPGDRQ